MSDLSVGSSSPVQQLSGSPQLGVQRSHQNTASTGLGGDSMNLGKSSGGGIDSLIKEIVHLLQQALGAAKGGGHAPGQQSQGGDSTAAQPTSGNSGSGSTPTQAGSNPGQAPSSSQSSGNNPSGSGSESDTGTGTGTGSSASAPNGQGGSNVESFKGKGAGGGTNSLNGMIGQGALSDSDPVPLNGGAKKQKPTSTAELGAAGNEAPNTVAKSGPLKGIPNGDALAAAAKQEGVSPYLLAGVAAVESGDNADNRVINNAKIKDGALQVNSGVWNSPKDVKQNAVMAAKLIKMYTKQAHGDVAKGLNGYNTGSVDQAGYAAKGNGGGRYSSYAAGVANAVANVKQFEHVS